MTDHEHNINRADSTRTSNDEAEEEDDDEDGQRSEAEIKRELRKSPLGRALLRRNRDLKRLQERGG